MTAFTAPCNYQAMTLDYTEHKPENAELFALNNCCSFRLISSHIHGVHMTRKKLTKRYSFINGVLIETLRRNKHQNSEVVLQPKNFNQGQYPVSFCCKNKLNWYIRLSKRVSGGLCLIVGMEKTLISCCCKCLVDILYLVHTT